MANSNEDTPNTPTHNPDVHPTYSLFSEIKKHVAKKMYEGCDEVSENYVASHPEDCVLGGQSAILIVDEFPNVYMTESPSDITTAKKRNNKSHTILCIAETNKIPTRMWLWLHMIEVFPEVLLLPEFLRD